MYIYEKVRARNFARAWGFAQFSMSIPNAIGIPALGEYLHKKKMSKKKLTSLFTKVLHISVQKIGTCIVKIYSSKK